MRRALVNHGHPVTHAKLLPASARAQKIHVILRGGERGIEGFKKVFFNVEYTKGKFPVVRTIYFLVIYKGL